MLNEDYRDILQIFLEEDVKFLVVGAYALSVHGYPRATGDIDIWVSTEAENSRKVVSALIKFGAPMDGLTGQEFQSPDTIFQVGVAPRRIDFITSIDGVEFDEAYRERVVVEIDNLRVPVISIKKLIQNKESTGREKDILDAKVLRKKL